MTYNFNPMGADLSLTSSTPDQTPNKLHDAARQFEALMITEMLKTARETSSDGSLSGDEETGEDSSMSLAEGQFAQAISNNGGLGLAKMIERTMSRSGDSPAGVPSDLTPAR